MKEILHKLVKREGLTAQEAKTAMDSIMEGRYTPAQTAAFLVALKMKGETREEIAVLAKAMRDHAIIIRPDAGPLVDTCGTGGDSSNTFNISTTAAFIAAGSGVAIAKHGNRAMSGRCGSADVLEELGAKMLPPDRVSKCIEDVGIGFMFAPFFHPAMKNVAGVRKELGIRTVFNILGPLTNPANAKAQVLGVFDASLTETMAEVLKALGTEHALVVHSGGMDEIGLGKTKVSELKDGKVRTYEIDASEFGFTEQKVPTVDSKEAGAAIMLSVLKGAEGPALDISLLNAAAAIYVGGKAESIRDGLELARVSVQSGAAMGKLELLRAFGGEDDGHTG
ncbi:anthranilate phosphoribosyltransferase [Candidatus Micrarchaeota archaeon]|nr:anthranilate phosphoribosyltransferase [Candidatus Micrarchaeota archaeon]